MSITAIVIGAGNQAGAEAVRALGKAGASLVLADHASPDLDGLAEEVGGHVVHTDIGNPVSVRRLVEQTLGAFGRIDVLVVAVLGV